MLMAQLGEKGVEKKRNLVVVVLLYVAYLVTGLDKRVAVIEARLGVTHQAVTAPGPVTLDASPTNFASVGPEWPQNSGSTFRR